METATALDGSNSPVRVSLTKNDIPMAQLGTDPTSDSHSGRLQLEGGRGGSTEPIFSGRQVHAAVVDEEMGVPMCTLTEPVSKTIARDVTAVAKRLAYVMQPSARIDRGRRLKDWDLWGPLFLCLILGIVLSEGQSDEQASYVFAEIFVTVWLGSFVVTANALLLRGNVSFFQTLSVLGYCICPLVISAVMGVVLESFFGRRDGTFFLRIVMIGGALVWSAKASIGFIPELVPDDRQLLGLYPVWLFYVAIAWMIVLA
eukprot:TRINITY_DN56169_c0_g1_i1.p1 TRINITY_DN56169_c0_g1~~TRINITY_DN56169_c0_g1_i1.p1  ORF type:complete len:258 (-),score=36.41 TRINITY_DN56169_c0_g1_i1:264-1037(-)